MIVVTLVCLTLLTTGLCPCQVHLREQCRGGKGGSLAIEGSIVGRQLLTSGQISDNLLIDLINTVAGRPFTFTVMQYDGDTTEVTYEIEVYKATEETCLVDVVLLRLLIEEGSPLYLIDHHIGTVDGGIMLLPCITNEEVGGLHGEVGQLTDMGGVSLRACLHIVGLQVVDIDTLIIEHAIEAIHRKLLIDTINGGLDILLAAIEVLLVNRTNGTLFQVCATAQCQCGSEYIVKIILSHNSKR